MNSFRRTGRRDGVLYGGEIRVAPAEKGLVGQDGDGRRPVAFVFPGDPDGVEVRPEQAPGGGAPLHLGDDRASGVGVERRLKVAGRGPPGDHLLQRTQGDRLLPPGHLAALCLDNFVQDHVIILRRFPSDSQSDLSDLGNRIP